MEDSIILFKDHLFYQRLKMLDLGEVENTIVGILKCQNVRTYEMWNYQNGNET